MFLTRSPRCALRAGVTTQGERTRVCTAQGEGGGNVVANFDKAHFVHKQNKYFYITHPWFKLLFDLGNRMDLNDDHVPYFLLRKYGDHHSSENFITARCLGYPDSNSKEGRDDFRQPRLGPPKIPFSRHA
jgi:hypothetical protein